MSAPRSPSLLDRPLRPDLAAFFAIRCCPASACTKAPGQPQTGVLAELARHTHSSCGLPG